MGIKFVPYVELVAGEVGTVDSGTADQLGTWSPNFNLSSYLLTKGVTYPSNATGVLILRVNTTTSARWMGIKNSNTATANLCINDIGALGSAHSFMKYETNGLISIYSENAGTSKYYVIGFTDDSVVYNDGSIALPFIERQSNGQWGARSVTGMPFGSTVIGGNQGGVAGYKIRYSGETHEPDALPHYGIFKLKSDNIIEIKSYSDLQIVGYMVSGVTQSDWRTNPFTPTKGSWQVAPVSYPGKRFVVINSDYTGGSNQFLARPSTGAGSTFDWGTVRNGKQQIVPLDDNGQFSYFITNTATCNNVWVESVIEEYEQALATLAGPSVININQSFTIAPSSFGGLLTSVTATDSLGNLVPIKLDGLSAKLKPPADGKYLHTGLVTVHAHSATKSASFQTTLLAETGHASELMEVQHIGPGNISTNWDIPLTPGDMIYYSTVMNTTFYTDGRFSTDYRRSWKAWVVYSNGNCESFVVGSSKDGYVSQADSPFYDAGSRLGIRKRPKYITLTGSGFGSIPKYQAFRRCRGSADNTTLNAVANVNEKGDWIIPPTAPTKSAYSRVTEDGYIALWIRNPDYTKAGSVGMTFPQSKQFRVEMCRHIPSGYSFAGSGTSGQFASGTVLNDVSVGYSANSKTVSTEAFISCQSFIGNTVNVLSKNTPLSNGSSICTGNDAVGTGAWSSFGIFIANHPSDPVGANGSSHYRITSDVTSVTKTTGSKIVSGAVAVHGVSPTVLAGSSTFGYLSICDVFLTETHGKTNDEIPIVTKSALGYRNILVSAGDEDCFQCLYLTNGSTLEASTWVAPIMADAWNDTSIGFLPDEWEYRNATHAIVLKPSGAQESFLLT